MTGNWESDRLNRKQDAEFLYNFIVGELEKRRSRGRTASYVLNVDADWGGGKSFFLNGLAQDLEKKKHIVVRVDAWRDDHAADPFVAIMAAIDKAFSPFTKKQGKIQKVWSVTKSSAGPIALKVLTAGLKTLGKKHFELTLEELLETADEDSSNTTHDKTEVQTASGEALKAAATTGGTELERLFDTSLSAMIDTFAQTEHAMMSFRENLEKSIQLISSKKTPPLFILVDELDRCRPTYAVNLLERVKHLFDVPEIVFIFATNTSQLQHSIAGAYGNQFDGFRYLKRFFDRTYIFSKPTMAELVEHLASALPMNKIRAPNDSVPQAITTAFEAFDLDLRAAEQVIEMIDATASAWQHAFPIEVALLIPLCINFYETGKAEWPKGRDNERLARWRLKNDRGAEIFNFAAVYQETLSYSRNIGNAFETSQDENIHRMQSGKDEKIYSILAFQREWTPCKYRSEMNKPSLQADLPTLVANAGRLLANISRGNL